MLKYFIGLAARNYPYRWCYAAGSAIVFLALAVIFFVFPRAVMIAALLAGPALALTWGMTMLCFWLEPDRGTLCGSTLFRRLPRVGQLMVQWYAAIFLVIWLIFGTIVWPAFFFLM